MLGRGDARRIAKRMDDPKHPQWSALKRDDPGRWQQCRDEIERAHEWGYRTGEERRSCIEATGNAGAREAREALAAAIDPEYAACIASPAARARSEQSKDGPHPRDCDEPAVIHQIRLGATNEGERCTALGDLAGVLQPAQAERLWREIEDHGTAYGDDVTRAMTEDPDPWKETMEMLDAARHGRTHDGDRTDSIRSAHEIWTLRATERSRALTPPEGSARLACRDAEMPEGGPRPRREEARAETGPNRATQASEAPTQPARREEAEPRSVLTETVADPARSLARQIHETRTRDPDANVRASAWRGLATLMEPVEAARAMGESDGARQYAGQTLRRNVNREISDEERNQAINDARSARPGQTRGAEPPAREPQERTGASGRGASQIARGFKPPAGRARSTGAERRAARGGAATREDIGR